MKKVILSLAAALTMFANASAFAAPVADSASEVSANEFVANEPTVNILYRSELDVPRNSRAFYDARDVKGKDGGLADFILKPGERKVAQYTQLSQGQKLSAGIFWFNLTSSNGSVESMIEPRSANRSKEIVADKDGYYLIEYTAPMSDAISYQLATGSTVYEKQ